MAHKWLPLLLLRAQAQAYTNDNDDAWINAPRSGSILTSERVDVALALRPSADTKQRVACLSTEQLDVADPTTTRDCFDVTVEGNTTKILEAGASVTLRPRGHWFKVELEMSGSTFAVAVYVAETTSIQRTPVGLAWDWGGGIGWGVAGLHIALALAGDERILPVPLGRAHLFEASEAQRFL